MNHDVYSCLSAIPTGEAGERIVRGCLVLEGGAFRGLYTQGALDAWMQREINFSCTVGVSAGALAGMSYVPGRSAGPPEPIWAIATIRTISAPGPSKRAGA